MTTDPFGLVERALIELGRAVEVCASEFEGFVLAYNLLETWVWSMETWPDDD